MDSDAPTIHMLRYMQVPTKTFREVESWGLRLYISILFLLPSKCQIVNQDFGSPASAFPLS